MYFTPLAVVAASLALLSSFANAACTSENRLAGAKLIPASYNMQGLGASAASFAELPLSAGCQTFINPDGGPAIPVAIDSTTTRAFALATRQVFSSVTGEYTDFDNGTTIIATNVTLGALHSIVIPVVFSANVYLTYDLDSCLIETIQAFATIPTSVACISVTSPLF